MKIRLICLLIAVNVFIVDAYPPFLGQPGCETDEELQVKYYRYLNNKTLYWKCLEKGKPAIVERCPNGKGFLEPERQCVHFSHWYYTPPMEPPPSSPEHINYGPYYRGPYGPYYQGLHYPYRKNML